MSELLHKNRMFNSYVNICLQRPTSKTDGSQVGVCFAMSLIASNIGCLNICYEFYLFGIGIQSQHYV